MAINIGFSRDLCSQLTPKVNLRANPKRASEASHPKIARQVQRSLELM